MKKFGLLNQPLVSVVAGMGHRDTIVIADAGLPIPEQTKRIDLALVSGIPGMVDVLKAVLGEMEVESVIIAVELENNSQEMHTSLMNIFADIPIKTVPHEEFKQLTKNAKAVVRTGEFTPYANIILIAGVTF